MIELDNTEERILFRLAVQLSKYYPCKFDGRSVRFNLIPGLVVTTIEDADSLTWWGISWLDRSGNVWMERYALDEFDKLLLCIEQRKQESNCE